MLYLQYCYIDVCPDGSNVVLCKANPCDVTKCEAHPEAECK